MVSATPRPIYPQETEPVFIAKEPGWKSGTVRMGPENIAPSGVRKQDRPDSSESLYRLRYRGSSITYLMEYRYAHIKVVCIIFLTGGRDSSAGIATRYGLDGPGIESRWGGRDFLHPSRPALGPTQPPIQWVPGLSRW